MDITQLITRGSARANTYKILSDCYYKPDEPLIKRLRNISIPTDPSCLQLSAYIPVSNSLESLNIDFSRLFIGPFKLLAPPYGSVYLENKRETMGRTTIEVKKLYAEEKLDISIKEAPDHIAVELEFVYFLISAEMHAISNSEHALAKRYLGKQRLFLRENLGAWMTEFCKNVLTNAQTQFYKNLVNSTQSFIERDIKYLQTRT